MRLLITLLGLCAALASAIDITAPLANSTYAAGSEATVKWTTVDTDPSVFSIYLVNFVDWPPSYVPLALHVSTSELSHTVQIPCDTNPSWGYQINAINGTNVYVIYAQSAKFSVSANLDADSCVDRTPPTSTCAAPSTVYVTVSPTGLPSSSSSSSSSSFSPVIPPTVSPSTTTPYQTCSTKPGTVPKTIGWQSDYSHPVTLKNPPTPTPTPVKIKVTSTITSYTTVTVTC